MAISGLIMCHGFHNLFVDEHLKNGSTPKVCQNCQYPEVDVWNKIFTHFVMKLSFTLKLLSKMSLDVLQTRVDIFCFHFK